MPLPSYPPTRVALDAEIRWALLRAFGPPRSPFPERVDGPRAVALVADLGLVERIGARVPSPLLVDELGGELARQLALSRLQVLARVRRLCDLIPELASAAAAAAIPIVLLKFAALHAGGYLAEGSRAAADIDILLPPGDVGRATEILTGRGFFAAEATLADHHHSPPLRDHQGRTVELHTRLPGLRPPRGRRFAGFEALEAAGALRPAPGLGGGCHLLRPELLAAHAVAHGLAQHGGADVYPVSRVLADVIDVLPGERRKRGMRAVEWIAADVSSSALEAVLGLCDALEKGDLDDLDGGREAGPQRALLQHVLASALDADYRRSVAVGHLFHSLSDEPRSWRFLKTVQCLVAPSKAQLAARLGLPAARTVTPRLRLAHAVALAGRLPRLARAALRLAGRR
jgi:hypothetical protein